MTDEEFHAHLMAALKGPHAVEIATRIAVVATLNIPTAVSDALEAKIAEMMDALDTFDIAMAVTVAVLADDHAERTKVGGDPIAVGQAIDTRAAAFMLLRLSARKQFEPLTRGSLAAIFVD